MKADILTNEEIEKAFNRGFEVVRDMLYEKLLDIKSSSNNHLH